MDKVLRFYCGKYNVYKDVLLSKRRDKVLVDIRQKIAKDLREKGYSYSDIGRILNRDHSSIMHLIKERKCCGLS